MNGNRTVIDFTTVPIPLAIDAHRLLAALRRAGLVHATDGLVMGMVFRDDLLAAVAEFLFIPLDRFKKTLQGPRRGLGLQGDRLDVFTPQIRQLSFDIDHQQSPGIASSKTIGEQREEQ
jgi:hypothetical protein